ncbi:MAG: HlyD family secretion protein [Daejeonella sp.]
MEEKEKTTKAKPKKKFIPFILGGLFIAALIFGFTKYKYASNHEETDDAQVEGNISPVAARVPGYITDIFIEDNQLVKEGDILVKLDDRDLQNKVAQAEAALENAKANLQVVRANVTSSRSNISTGGATIDAAKTKVWQAKQDYNRYANLIKDGSITQQQFDAVKAARDAAEAQLQVAIRQQNSSQAATNATGSHIAVAQSQITQRQTELDFARLQLSYATIKASSSGFIAKKNIQVGQLIQPGQALFAVVRDNKLWVTANFKETQLENIKAGQPVTVKVDAFSNKEFKGTVESFSPATGAKFSLLPPDNASGNFVKVVQRVPVKIYLEKDKDLENLRAGMNVKAIVSVN